MECRLARVDKPDSDANAGKQLEAGEALDEFIVSSGDAALAFESSEELLYMVTLPK